MTRVTRRSGVVLVVLGVLGGLYFWLTDPRYGPAAHARPQGAVDVTSYSMVMVHIGGSGPTHPLSFSG